MKTTLDGNMSGVITEILAKKGHLEAFQNADRFDCEEDEGEFLLKLSIEGFMPLVIERFSSRVTVTHYREQNGDLIADPDVEFRILKGGEWLPVVYQDTFGYRRAVETSEGGKLLVNTAEMKSLQRFLKMWARNLKAQGWDEAKIIKSSLKAQKSEAESKEERVA